MFGILHALGVVISSTIKSVKEQISDYESKEDTSNGFTYIDSKGKTRLLSNNHQIYIQYDKEKEVNNYIDLKTNKIIKSEMPQYIKELNDELIDDYKKRGFTVYLYKCRGLTVKPYYRSNIYKDIYTDEKYVIRKVRDRQYFYSIETGKPIREEDSSLKDKRKREGIHDDEWNKAIDVTLYSDPNFPEAKYFH